MNKKITVLIVLLALLIVVSYVYLKNHTEPVATVNTNQNVNSAKDIVRTEVDPAKLPERFPKDIPFEKNPTIVQNYNATAADGRLQATRVLQTTKSLTENVNFYKNYLVSAGYKVTGNIDQPNYKMVFGEKGTTSIQVSVRENSITNVKTVSITYSEQPTSGTSN